MPMISGEIPISLTGRTWSRTTVPDGVLGRLRTEGDGPADPLHGSPWLLSEKARISDASMEIYPQRTSSLDYPVTWEQTNTE